jgi:hypothetical protein
VAGSIWQAARAPRSEKAAAADDELLSGDCAGFCREQERHSDRDFIGANEPADRRRFRLHDQPQGGGHYSRCTSRGARFFIGGDAWKMRPVGRDRRIEHCAHAFASGPASHSVRAVSLTSRIRTSASSRVVMISDLSGTRASLHSLFSSESCLLVGLSLKVVSSRTENELVRAQLPPPKVEWDWL